MESLEKAGVAYTLFDDVSIEPTDERYGCMKISILLSVKVAELPNYYEVISAVTSYPRRACAVRVTVVSCVCVCVFCGPHLRLAELIAVLTGVYIKATTFHCLCS